VCATGGTTNGFTLTLSGATAASNIQYQWQSSSDDTTYSNISGANSTTLALTQTAATYYRCVVTCTNSSTSSNSTSVLVGYSTNCYCANGATNLVDEDILNVTFGTLNNSSSSCSGLNGATYTNFKSVAAPSVAHNSTVNFSVQVGTCNSANYANGIVIFIDYNQNGTFDTGEKAYISTAIVSGPNTVSGTITIPNTATLGNTLMRVTVIEANIATIQAYTGCSTYSWGETEDYIINIIAAPACSGTPSPGSITASSISSCSSISLSSTLSITTPMTESGLTYQWQESTNNSDFTDISGQTNPSSCVITLTSVNKYYRLKVTCSNGGGIGYSSSQLIYYDCTNYCIPTFTSGVEPIVNVTFNTINNTSSSTCSVGSQFENFTNNSTNVIRDQSYSLSVTGNTCGNWTHYIRAYFDWNSDGYYLDSGESYDLGTINNNTAGVVNQSILIPVTASLGNTRMRIMKLYNGYPSGPCQTGTGFGQAEDYSIVICANPTITSPTVNSTPSICDGSNTSFSVTATTPSGTGTLTYQWQVNTGSGFSNLADGGVYSNVTTNTMTITEATTAMSGYIYRCIVGNSCSGSTTSATSTLTVNPLPTITADATAVAVCPSASAQNTFLSYTGTTNTPTTYSIAWSAGAITAGFTNVTNAALPASPFTIVVPAGAAPATYNGTLIVKNANTCESTGNAFSVTVKALPTASISYAGTP
jgi:hypothetical protein